MKYIGYVLLIVVIIIVLLCLHGFYKRLRLLRMMWASYLNIGRLGYIIAISGQIRSGKTTLTSGLTQLLTIYLRNKLVSRLEEIKIILKDINFTDLEKFIIEYEIDIDSFDERINDLIMNYLQDDDLGEVKALFKLDEPYYDYLVYKDKIELLKEYVKCYLNLYRRSYVYSSIRMWNQINKSYCLEFDNSWIRLKENKDFPLLEYSVFVEDDKLIYDANIGFMKKLHEDSGSDLFYRLFGHLFRENSYYICTLQDVNRWVKLEREIAQSHIYIIRSNVVGNYPKINKLLDIYEWLLNTLVWIRRKIFKKEFSLDKRSWFKDRFYKIYQIRKKLFSKAFVYYETAVYSDIDKVGKKIKEDDRFSYYFDFVLPVEYVYGNVNTHEFNVVYEYLYKRSKKKYKDVKSKVVDVDEVLEILKKYNERETTNNNNISDNLDDVFL